MPPIVAVRVHSERSAAGKFVHSRTSCSRASFSVLRHRSVSIAMVLSPAMGVQVGLTFSVGTSAAAWAASAARLTTAMMIVRIGKPMSSPSVATRVNGEADGLFQRILIAGGQLLAHVHGGSGTLLPGLLVHLQAGDQLDVACRSPHAGHLGALLPIRLRERGPFAHEFVARPIF